MKPDKLSDGVLLKGRVHACKLPKLDQDANNRLVARTTWRERYLNDDALWRCGGCGQIWQISRDDLAWEPQSAPKDGTE